MRKTLFSFIFFISTTVIYPSVTLFFDPSEPPRYEINGINRRIDNIDIDIYYRTGFIYSYIDTISFNNGSFNPNSISIDIQTLDGAFFYAVYHLNNNYAEISGYTSKIPQNQLTDLENLGRVVGLKLSAFKDKLMFPITKPQGNFINLHLAMHAHYVLTHYLSQPPVDKYFKMWNYPIPVSIDTVGNIENCCYHSNKDKYNRDISVSTRIDLSYLDCVYKHEYGHHIYHTIFGIEQTNYTKDYEIFESCDEQTAVNEGLSFFLMSQGPFEPFLSNDMPSNVQLNLDPTQNDIQKNFLSRSGESTIYSVASALYELSKKDSNGVENILDIYNKVKPTFFQQIWNKITDAEKTADTNYVIDKNKLKYRQYLELLGIVYNRGIISLVDGISKDNQQPAIFEWGGKTFKNKLPLINKSIVADRSRITIPTFPLNVAFHLQSANNDDLMPANVGKGYYGLKIQGVGADGDPVSSEMETSKSFNVQLLKIKDYDFADNQLKKIVCGGTILYVGKNKEALDKFYSKYWKSDDWETVNVNSNGETDTINLSYDEVYGLTP